MAINKFKGQLHPFTPKGAPCPQILSIPAWRIPWTEEPGGLQSSSVQSLSPVQVFATPMDCSTPGFPVHHQLPVFTQTHVHLVGDAIQPSHPLSSASPPAFNLSQHQGLFQ